MSKKERENIPVVILCGGQGTRMRGELDIKKELVKIGDKPIIWHIMKYFSMYGHHSFALTLGYLADQMKKYFLEYDLVGRDITLHLGEDEGYPHIVYHQQANHPAWEVSLVDTGLKTDKGTRIAKVKEHLNHSRFFVSYGDDISNVDLDKLVKFHIKHGKMATITAVRVNFSYGVVEADKSGLVSGFIEKPPLPYWINGGFMLFEREVLDLMSANESVNLETDVLAKLAKRNELMIYRHRGFWQSMNTLKETILLNKLWEENKAPWKIWQD